MGRRYAAATVAGRALVGTGVLAMVLAWAVPVAAAGHDVGPGNNGVVKVDGYPLDPDQRGGRARGWFVGGHK